ncbi:MAG: hypothetical protein ACP6IY_21270, partial [Promethearchaeia archaeon]
WNLNSNNGAEGVCIDNDDNIFLVATMSSFSVGSYDIGTIKYVEYKPSNFTLYSNAGNPDTDGKWTLTWDNVPRAENYSLYYSNSPIVNITDTTPLLQNVKTPQAYLFSTTNNGTYYFIVVAFNPIGNSTSNQLQITVKIPPASNINEEEQQQEEEEEKSEENEAVLITIIILVIIAGVAVPISIYVYKNQEKVKEGLNKIIKKIKKER